MASLLAYGLIVMRKGRYCAMCTGLMLSTVKKSSPSLSNGTVPPEKLPGAGKHCLPPDRFTISTSSRPIQPLSLSYRRREAG